MWSSTKRSGKRHCLPWKRGGSGKISRIVTCPSPMLAVSTRSPRANCSSSSVTNAKCRSTITPLIRPTVFQYCSVSDLTPATSWGDFQANPIVKHSSPKNKYFVYSPIIAVTLLSHFQLSHHGPYRASRSTPGLSRDVFMKSKSLSSIRPYISCDSRKSKPKCAPRYVVKH